MPNTMLNKTGKSESCSPYEAIVKGLDQRGMSSDKLQEPTAPEDLSSRSVFPHEQSREPGLYDAVLTRYDKR